jgi:hypothetical protein
VQPQRGPKAERAPLVAKAHVRGFSVSSLIPHVEVFVCITFLLASGDAFFIGLHAIYTFQFTANPVFSLDGDRVAGEIFQYLKEFWIVLASLMLYRLRRQPVFAAWSLTFAYILADDSMELHEKAGQVLAKSMYLPSLGGMLPVHTGQLVFAAACAVALFLVMGLLYLRADANARRVSCMMLAGLLLVGVFGVGADFMHVWTNLDVFIIVEEGGELIAMSLICAFMLSEAWPAFARPLHE